MCWACVLCCVPVGSVVQFRAGLRIWNDGCLPLLPYVEFGDVELGGLKDSDLGLDLLCEY